MLELKQVSFAYQQGRPALIDVSLTIDSGEFLAIAGRNGSGKTTLTRMIMSLKKPSSGMVLYNGADTVKYTPANMARYVGYVFQNPDRQMFRDTVAAEVSFGPEQLGFSADQIEKAVAIALEKTNLTAVASSYPQSLSRGQKQRVAIASALAMQSRILILDEPTSGQDANERQELLSLLQELNKQGITIVLVTHDMDIIAQYASRVIVMAGGRKVFDNSPEELFNNSGSLAAWGLTLPASVKIAREIAKFGIPYCADIHELHRHIETKLFP